MNTDMERIRVMVTGVGGGGNGEQLVKALKMSDKNYYPDLSIRQICSPHDSVYFCGLYLHKLESDIRPGRIFSLVQKVLLQGLLPKYRPDK